MSTFSLPEAIKIMKKERLWIGIMSGMENYVTEIFLCHLLTKSQSTLLQQKSKRIEKITYTASSSWSN